MTQKAAEMNGRKGRIVPLRNIHIKTPEVLLVLSLYIYIYIYIYIFLLLLYNQSIARLYVQLMYSNLKSYTRLLY